MRRRLWIILVLAVVSGGSAAYFALAYLRDSTPTLLAADKPTQQVAVGARDLPLGTVIQAADVKMIDWFGDAVAPGLPTSAELVVGRGLITPVRANEVLLETKLAAKGAGAGLAVTIPEGMRAVSVRVDEVIGVAGFVLPGTRVDVVLTLPPKDQRRESVSQIILQNMRILAAGQIVQQDAQGKPITVSVITILVTPQDGELLILAANEGKIQMALRNTLDEEEVRTRGAYANRLLPGTRDSAAIARARRAAGTAGSGTVVEAYRGGVRTLIKF